MSRRTLDRLFRGCAILAAVVVVVLASLNPQFRMDGGAGATPKVATRDQPAKRSTTDRGYTYLLESPEHAYPARWCPGIIGYSLDLTVLRESGLDPQAETQRWATVFDAWSEHSSGQYTFEYRGDRALRIDSDGQLDVDGIEPGTIGIMYVHGDADQPLGGYESAAVRGRTAGNGGLQVTSVGAGDEGALVGDRGFVLIDVDDAADLSPNGLRRALYQHESGHALGLGHVTESTPLMHPTLSTDRLAITPFDTAGLVSLASMPCRS